MKPKKLPPLSGPKTLARGLGLVLSCEHAVQHLPEGLDLSIPRRILQSHRGWDPGAEPVAKKLSAHLHAPLISAQITRLALDHNRSIENPQMWSIWSQRLSAQDKQYLLNTYFLPHRQNLREQIEFQQHRGLTSCHLSIHSFTPIWRGRRRPTTIGILFDPDRPTEKFFCLALRQELTEQLSGLRLPSSVPKSRFQLHFNRPYRGSSDGATTAMRRLYPAERYIGVEIEINQAWLGSQRQVHWISELLGRSLAQCFEALLPRAPK